MHAAISNPLPAGRQGGEHHPDELSSLTEQPQNKLALWRSRCVASLGELYAHPDLTKEMPWDFRPFTAAGHISLLSAAPKVGKSTFMGLYAHAKATGGEFLGQVLSRGKVLIVAPDESWTAIGRRHKQLGSPPDQIYLWFDLEPTIKKIAAKAAQLGADLILVDTLSRVAPVLKENDNAAWTRWFTENDPHFRDSRSAWLFSHHDRKGGGSEGEGIRGASAILGCVDIAFSLQRLGHRQQRILRMEGTRFDQVEDLIIQIDGDTYRVIGDRQTAAVLANDEIMRVDKVLTDQPATVTEVVQALERDFPDRPDIPLSTLRRRLEELVEVGRAVPHGKGGQRDPRRYSKVRSLERGYGIPDKHTQPYVPNTDTLSTVSGQGLSTVVGEGLSTVPSPRGWTGGQAASNGTAEQEQQGVPPPVPGRRPEALDAGVRHLPGKAGSLKENGTGDLFEGFDIGPQAGPPDTITNPPTGEVVAAQDGQGGNDTPLPLGGDGTPNPFTSPTETTERGPCSWPEGCTKPAGRDGLCGNHWLTWNKARRDSRAKGPAEETAGGAT